MGLLTDYRATVAVLALTLALTACGSDDGNTAAPAPSPTPTATPTPTPTQTPEPTPTPKPSVKPEPKKVVQRCVGTFQNGGFTLNATDGARMDGEWYVCGYSQKYFHPQLYVGQGVRIYAGNSTALIRPGKTVAIGGYNVRVRFVRGSTAVFDIDPR